MKGISVITLAHPRFERARLRPSRRRVLAAPGDGTDANQHTFPDPLGFARPFAPSSPRPNTRLRAGRIGGFTPAFPATSPTHDRRSCGPSPRGYGLQPASLSPDDWQASRSGRSHTARIFRHPGLHKHMDTRALAPSASRSSGFHASRQGRQPSPPTSQTGHTRGRASGQIRFALAGSTRTAYQEQTPVFRLAFNGSGAFQHPAQPDLSDQARISDVKQDSDFRTEIASRKKPCFSAVPPCVRRTPGDFATSHRFHLRQPNTYPLKIMAYPKKLQPRSSTDSPPGRCRSVGKSCSIRGSGLVRLVHLGPPEHL